MLRFFPLKIAEVRAETPSSISIAFEVPPRWRRMYEFKQGQYLSLRALINRREIRRTYSICSGVNENELRVAVKRMPGGRFSNHVIDTFRTGQMVDVMPPHGRFFTTLEPQAQRRYILCATGSGITPVISILKTVLAVEPLSQLVLFYGNRSEDEIMFREQLGRLVREHTSRLTVQHYLSRENPGPPYHAGRLGGHILESARDMLGNPSEWHACFLCGASEMTAALAPLLETSGVPADRIHVELFKGLAGFVPEGIVKDATATVIFEGQRAQLTLGEGTVLDAALEAGIDLPYACRMGSCCSCLAKVLEGKAHIAVNNALSPKQLDTGYVLTCQTRSLTPQLVLDCDVDDLKV